MLEKWKKIGTQCAHVMYALRTYFSILFQKHLTNLKITFLPHIATYNLSLRSVLANYQYFMLNQRLENIGEG